MSQVQAHAVIEGTRPFLFHMFSVSILDASRTKEKKGSAGNNPEEWHTTFLSDENGQLFFRPDYVVGSVVTAGKSHKSKGRTTYMNALASTLQVAENKVYFNRFLVGEPLVNEYDADVYLDVRSVVNPATRGRNVRYRLALSAGWQAAFTLVWENTIVGTDIMPYILQDAGLLVGVGDGRKIGMGCFDVVNYELLG